MIFPGVNQVLWYEYHDNDQNSAAALPSDSVELIKTGLPF